MAKPIHKGTRKAGKAVVHKAAGRSASVFKPEESDCGNFDDGTHIIIR